MTIATPELMLRSMTDDWTLARWEALPDDGNRETKYEVRTTKYEQGRGRTRGADSPSLFVLRRSYFVLQRRFQ